MTHKFKPCPMDVYVDWLRRYLRNGGSIGYYRDHSYATSGERTLLALENFKLEGECGADAYTILVPGRIKFSGSLGHNVIYTENPIGVQGHVKPSVYTDDVFHNLPGYADMRDAAVEKARQREAETRALLHQDPYGDLGHYRAATRNTAQQRTGSDLLECASCGAPRNNDLTVKWQDGKPYCDPACPKGR